MAVYGPSGQEELYHYGVLGMKWGVRKNPRRAYEKSTKKLKQIGESVSKADSKKKKYANPLIRTSISDAKYEKWSRQYDKRRARGEKWYSSMKSEFSKVGLDVAKANSAKNFDEWYEKHVKYK